MAERVSNHRIENAVLRAGMAAVRLIPGGRRPDRVERILVVRLGNLGDIIVTLPAFHALRKLYPKAHITLLTSPTRRGAPGAVEVLARDNTFDEMIVYYEDESRAPAFLRQLRGRLTALQPGLAVVMASDKTRFDSLAKYLILLPSCGIRRIVGLRRTPHAESLGGHVPHFLRVVEQLGRVHVEPFPWIRVDEEDHAYARALLNGRGPGPLIAMQCGAKRSTNRWMPARFAELGRRLVADHGATLVLTGSPSERELTALVADGVHGNCINVAGETDIPRLAALTQACDLLVSNDTGTMHVAAAMGTPVVALFSGRDYPGRWDPYGDAHEVIRKPVDCSPCLAENCPRFDEPECMRLIEVRHVADAVARVLGRNGAAPSTV